MLKRMVVGSLLAAAFVGYAARDISSPGPGALAVTEEPGRIVMRWKGQVEAPMRDQFEQAFDRLKRDQRPVVIALDSAGGRVQHGSEVISLILKHQRERNVYTLVEAGAKCASMCVPIYLAGSRRSASPSAKFMFHEVSFGRQVDDQLRQLQEEHGGFRVAEAKRYLVNAGTDDLFEKYLKTAGANPKWMADMRRQVRGRDVWRSGRELVEQRSGVVHTLAAQQ